ncbi:Cna B-type protein [Candidatus Koribacter versatilis Ellin345]|uniref:Cna B-type protein n=1 Tax=Koribacter versatilis (strain Ellin345) TaxID=204669 RepID=Q1IKU3_KORVE|nr:TonB-dependent receptor [Candidatus Koribacter versatilis]ABF42507.1 Cna B-type protein [Candidatus Koribacter versatilis Ellin345]
MRTTVIRVLAVLALLFVFTSLVFGQAETGQVTGTVTDPSGAIVAGAKVTITDVNTGAQRTGTTNSSGSYTFTNLKPSTYDVVVEGSGFAKFTRRVDVTVGSKNEVSAQMSVTGGGTTVEVTAEGGAAQVNTESQTLSTVVTSKQVTELPTLTRNPYDLVATSGNVNDDPSARGAGLSINGQRSASTDILLDGGENVDLFTATVGQSVPLDSVQEFRVITSDFSAEYGRASGGVVNVATKSGTNAFHGTAYEFNRVSALAANTYINDSTRYDAFNGVPIDGLDPTCVVGQPCDAGKKGGFTRNQFGYSIGGPVVKNKLFFFSSTEWTRVRSSATQNAAVIDPSLIGSGYLAPNVVDFLNSASLRSSATTVGHVTCDQTITPTKPLGQCPTAIPGSQDLYQLVSFTLPNDSGGGAPQNTYSTVNRVDWNISDKTTLYGRYALYSEADAAGTNSWSPYDGFDTGTNVFNNNLNINLTHVFTPNFVSQSKIIYNRLNNQQPLGAAPIAPTLYSQANTVPRINGAELLYPGYLPFSPGNAIPFGGPQNLYQLYQDFSWTKGKHQFRFGGDYIQTRDNRVFGAYETAVSILSNGNADRAINNLFSAASGGGDGTLDLFEVGVNPQGAYPCPRYLTPKPAYCQYTTPVGPPSFSRNNGYNDGAWYVQDSWKIHPRVTLNLGLRWEYYGVQHNSDPNLESNFYEGPGSSLPAQIYSGQVMIGKDSPSNGLWDKDTNNYAPRIGFAWDVFGDGKTSIRGGYGISYERNFGNVTYNVIQNPPNYAVVTAGGIPLTTGNYDSINGGLPDGTLIGLSQPSLRLVSPHIKTAYSEFWSLSLEREVLKNSILAFEYSGSHGVHLYDIGNVNKAGFGNYYDPADMQAYATGVLGLADASDMPCYPLCKLNQQYGNANNRGDQGFSHYNSLNTRFTSNNLFNLGLQLNFNWTWSHAIDNLSNTFSEGSNSFQLGYTDYFHPNLDTGSAEFNATHRLAISGVWDMPFGKKSSNGFVRAALGGWSVSPIITYRTGQPYTIWDCWNGIYNCSHFIPAGAQGRDGGYGTAHAAGVFDYMSINPVWATADGSAPHDDGTNPAFPGTPGRGGSVELPLAPCQGAVGCQMYTGPRDNYIGPGNHQFNMVVGKQFKLTERFSLQFRGEMYNVFNNHNLYILTGNNDVSTGLPNVQASKGGYGNSTDERRNVQFGLKLIF